MITAGPWLLNQENTIKFVMTDSSGNELTGLTLTVELDKGTNDSFAAGTGTAAEIGDGWYRYTSSADDADTRGAIAVKITAAGARQQNLEYVVEGRNAGAIEVTYTVTDDADDPIEGVTVWISTDLAGTNIIWSGVTTSLGVAVDTTNGNKPYLDAGTYYFWLQKDGFTFASQPDTEVVS